MTTIPANTLPSLLSGALDEIYFLRTAAAVESLVVLQHLAFKSFPASRRRFGEQQVERLRQSARGHVEVAYAGMIYLSLDSAMREASAPTKSSVSDWAAGQPVSRWATTLDDSLVAEVRDDLRRAVQEINRLSRAMAYEASVLLVHASYARFPKGPYNTIAVQAGRMRAAACGRNEYGYDVMADGQSVLESVGAQPTLTLGQWKAQPYDFSVMAKSKSCLMPSPTPAIELFLSH